MASFLNVKSETGIGNNLKACMSMSMLTNGIEEKHFAVPCVTERNQRT